MARSEARTVTEYLDALPPDRRGTIEAVRRLILEHLPDGYEESMSWGMPTWEIPLEAYPDTYNGKPLACLALAAQKNHNALYMMGVYGDAETEARLRGAFEAEGKRFDMGKACLRFRDVEDLALDAVGEVVAGTPPEALIEKYEASRAKGR